MTNQLLFTELLPHVTRPDTLIKKVDSKQAAKTTAKRVSLMGHNTSWRKVYNAKSWVGETIYRYGALDHFGYANIVSDNSIGCDIHEGYHLSMLLIEDEYGDKFVRKLLTQMYRLIPLKVKQVFKQYLKINRYNINDIAMVREESIILLFDCIISQDVRRTMFNISDYKNINRFNRYFINTIKKVWRQMVTFARQVDTKFNL